MTRLERKPEVAEACRLNRLYQRVTIAEACGWKWVEGRPDAYTGSLHRGFMYHWRQPDGHYASSCFLGNQTEEEAKLAQAGVLPDYFSDLNAMHDAETMLNSRDRTAYRALLSASCKHPYHTHYVHATAEQRAIAFLHLLATGRGSESATGQSLADRSDVAIHL